jgi:hypothetical protein
MFCLEGYGLKPSNKFFNYYIAFLTVTSQLLLIPRLERKEQNSEGISLLFCIWGF